MYKKQIKFPFVEPLLFLTMIADSMTGNVFTDMILYQTCRHITVTNKTKCDIFYMNASDEEARLLHEIVQPHTSYILMVKSLFESILPALLILFIGPLSDKHGRKPLLIIGCLVPTCRYIILSILSNFDVNPWMFLLSSVPTAALGCGLSLATVCYVSDTTEPDKRTTRITYLQLSTKIGFLTGTFIGPLIFKKFGSTFLFNVATIVCGLSLFHASFLVPESLKNKSDEKWSDSLNLSSAKEPVLILTRKSNGLNRKLFWSSLLIYSLYKIITNGNDDIIYLYVHAKLGWDILQYSAFNSFANILLVVGTVGGIKLMKDYLNLTDITTMLIGCVSGMLGFISLSFATNSWDMYIQSCLGIFRGIIFPATRSVMSQSAPAEDLGKIFSLAAVVERLTSLLSSPLYSFVYSSSILNYPSPVYLMTSGIFLIIIIINRTINSTFNQKTSSKLTSQSNSS